MRDKWIKKIVETLLSPLEFSGEHRRKQWEKGWKQNFVEGNLMPHYFGKYPVVRKDGEFIEAPEGFEYQQLVNLENEVFEKYLKAESIVEVGCGTGHNLVRLKDINPTATIYGLDWVDSSVSGVNKLGFKGVRFDMFQPEGFDFKDKSVFTMASLEQLGDRFKPFVDYIMSQKPTICVHLEPIEELMGDSLLDYLQIEYMKKRKYLTGFLTYLRELEKNGKIEIIEASRNGVGSLFLEGYSLVVWKPTR